MKKTFQLMHKTLAAALLALLPAGCSAQNTPEPLPAEETKTILPVELDNYIAREEPAYRWEKVERNGREELRLVSQTWQGQPWTHRVQIFRPANPVAPDTAILQIDVGIAIPGGDMIAQMLANATGLTIVNLYNVPNQPLYDRREDALIAYTFQKYLETGDATWPLLFPMTKSAVKAMDAVTEYSTQQNETPITKFIVTGASKRGWTTWMTGAVDKRVIGIMPMVYDNLNLAAQMPHQLEVWGDYSGQIDDYTELGLQEKMQTPTGQKLGAMVDPYTYRERITMPKLIVIGTNDQYWPLDAVNLYREDLTGPVNYLYAPNAGHELNGQETRTIASAAAWARRVARGEELPTVELKMGEVKTDGKRDLILSAASGEARLWIAHSPTRDFRQAKWRSYENLLNQRRGVYMSEIDTPPAGTKYSAAIGETQIKEEGLPLPLVLSSPVVVWENEEK